MKKNQQRMKNECIKLMKSSLTQLFLSAFFVTMSFATPKAQDILEKKITVNLENVELRDALSQLERTADVQFGYSSKAIQVKRKVTIFANNQRLADVLNNTFKPMDITYRVVNGQIILTTATSETLPLSISDKKNVKSETTQSIGGTVRDEQGNPMPGVSVQIKGTSKGVQTFLDGKFQIDANPEDVLVISSVGFVRQEITITNKDQTNLTIVLKEDQSTLGEVTVVGSRFSKPRTDVDRPVPIDVITIKDIQAAGQVDLGQALHFSAPSFNAMKFGINDAAPFVDPATLRGLGPDQVLMLVNGKRRHKVSFLSINDGVGKGQAGTDINVVPALSLKRVEVLRDGAAAQYGSDAIAGVINLQLNNASKGGAVTTYYGQGYSKPNLDVKNVIAPTLIQDGKTYNVSANVGLKLGKAGFLNATGTYSHTDGYDRSGTYKASAGYYVKDAVKDDSLVKANGINLNRAVLGSAENTTYGIFINAGMPINANWDFYTFGGYTKKHVITGVFTRPPSNVRRSVLSIFPNGYNPIAPADLQDFSLTAGVKGKLGNDWNLDLSAGQGSNQVDWYAENTVNPSLGATYNGQTAPTSFYVGQTYVSQTLVNADLSKSFNKDSYPNFSIATGTEFRYETFKQTAGDPASYEAGPLKATRDIGSSGREGFSNKTAGKWNRTNVGLYVEGESDLTKSILVGAAVRGENYSDFGSDISAKFNTRIKITNAIAVRGSVSRGFRAPSITQSHYSNYINISFDNAGNSITNPIIPAESDLAKVLGVEGLKKETSLDYSGGATAKLGEHFTLTADVYQIDVDNRIMLSGGIKTSGFPQFVAAGFPQTANVFVNAIDTRTKGFEFVANYNTPIGTDSKINLNAAYSSMATTLRANRKTTTGIEVVDAVAAAYITDGQPKNKFIGSVNYDYKMVGLMFRASHFGTVKDPLATLATADPATGLLYQTFSAKTLLDLSITYRPIKNLGIVLGVNNLTDVYPDLLVAPQTSNEVIFSRRTNQFGTQGRFWNLTLNYNF